jgi:hypothetical protein
MEQLDIKRRLLELNLYEHQHSVFVINGEQLETVESFIYLGRPISSTGLDSQAIMLNITKAHKRWAMISKILTWQGSTPKVMGYFYKLVCQAVLLYGCETWVITSTCLKKLESFHHRVARQISKCRIHIDPNTGEWIHPPIANALSIAGLLPLSKYIQKRRKYLLPWAAQSDLFQQSRQLGCGVNTSQRLYWSSQLTIEEIT